MKKINIKKGNLIFISLCSFLSFFMSSSRVFADSDIINILPDEMTEITPSSLQYIYGGNRMTGMKSTQSFTITDKYFVVSQLSSDDADSIIIATDYSSPSTTPAWTTTQNVGHGNDATWNNNTGQIIITDKYNRYFFDAESGEYLSTKISQRYASGIEYDGATNRFFEARGTNPGILQIIDGNTDNVITSFDTSSQIGAQNVAYYNNHIYRTAWSACNGNADATNTCQNGFGNGANVIYQFDNNGNYTDAFYVWSGNNSNKWFGELEALAFSPNGVPYLLFNGHTLLDRTEEYSVYKIIDEAILNKMGVNNDKYTLRYNPNGGLNAPNDQTCQAIGVNAGCSIIVVDDEPAYSGHSFKGWSTSDESDTPDYRPGEELVLRDNIMLYAVWENDAPQEDTDSDSDDEKTEEQDNVPEMPDTGSFTGESNANQIMTSIIGISLGALFVAIMPRLFHKKISFKK